MLATPNPVAALAGVGAETSTQVQAVVLKDPLANLAMPGLAEVHKILVDRLVRKFTKPMRVRFGALLNLSEASLRRLRAGWDGEAITFPMVDPIGEIIGIRRRFSGGRNGVIQGSRDGLFVPTGLGKRNPLFICTGPTDTAAILDLGFSAVGRPSCRSCVRFIMEFARGRHVVILAASKARSQLGALRLGGSLMNACPSVRILSPPPACGDARRWLAQGATAQDIEAALGRADQVINKKGRR